MNRSQLATFSFAFFVALFSCTNSENEKPKVDYATLTDEQKRKPENAIHGLESHPELEVSLFASEPLLVNPTNIDIDAKGRVWATEGFNYRIQIHTKNPVKEKGDRIVILEDEDGDGKADTSKVFYQGTDINSALGIAVFGNEVIVSCSPLVMHLTDTDGDDKADKKEILFTGIGGEQHDHGVHAFVFGPDGKLYFNFGNSGTQLLDKDGNPIKDKNGAVIDNSGNPFRQGMIFRCDRDGSNIEVLGHNFRNNYEVAVDSYGTLWQSDNDDDGNRGVRINYVMEYGNYGYTDEMSGAGWRSRRTGMHDSIPIRHWHQNDPGSVPNLLQTGSGSPTGMIVYEGKLLPKEFVGEMIHCEPGHNVVRSYPVQNDGAGYSASITNIIKSVHDQWFRPSDVCVAPDGSLMVADWYDPGVGGHGVGDLKQGRIFRIAPKNTDYKIKSPEINLAEEAAEALKSPSMSIRYLAWMKLNELGKSAEEALKTLWNSDNQIFRARALWLLAAIDAGYIDEAIKDENPDIRITGIRTSRNMNGDNKAILKQLVQDESAQVRREIAIALRNDNSAEAEDIWVDLAVQHDGKDRWYLEALGIGAQNKSENLYKKWLAKVGDKWDSPAGRDIIWRSRADQALTQLADIISNQDDVWENRLRYFRAFDFHSSYASNAALLALLKKDIPNKDLVVLTSLSHFSKDFVESNAEIKSNLKESLAKFRATQKYFELVQRFEIENEFDNVLQIALDSTDNGTGVEAIRLLMEMKKQDFVVSSLNQSNAKSIIGAIGKIPGWRPASFLREIYYSFEGDVDIQRYIVEALSNSRAGQRNLIGIIEKGDLAIEMESLAIDIFLASGHEDLRKKAAGLLESPEISEGKKFPPIAQLMKLDGDTSNGEKVFERSCAMCHLVNGKGVDFGPKLSEIGSKLARSAMYKAILDPAEAVSFGYEGYDIKMKDGSEVRGYISSDTENYIELTMVGGMSNRYQKDEIESITEIEGSLMTNMAVAMEQQELVDLVSYLEGLK
ncbi:MAG: PQQ-dependent sugar dehydrogenase [Cyclobacteriaceae bacterium]